MVNKSETRQPAMRLSLFASILLLSLLLLFSTQTAYGIAAYVGATPENLEVGDSTTVTVTFSGDGIGRVRAILEYDPSVLSYQGEGGDTGTVSLTLAGEGTDIRYNLPFKAVGSGESYLTLTPQDAYDIDEAAIALPEAQRMSVYVSDKQQETTEPAAPTEEKKDDADATEAKPNDKKDDTAKADDEDKKDPAKADDQEDTTKAASGHATLWVLLILAVIVAALLVYLRRRHRAK